MTKKKLYPIILIFLFTKVCWSQNDSLSTNSRVKSLKNFYNKTLVKLSDIPDSDLNVSLLGGASKEVTEVDLQSELVKLFDPGNFSCNYDEKLIKQLKKLKNSNGTDGFVPRSVTKNITEQLVYKLKDQGSSILANSFSYIKNGTESKLHHVKYSPTAVNFNEAKYLETNTQTHSNFVYNMDCSGYFTASMAVSGGVDKNIAKSAASHSSGSSNSLVLIKGVMYLPLYQAYQQEGAFKAKDKETLITRKSVISQIIQTVPNVDREYNVQIVLNTNYRVLLTSNSGKSNFNGEANLSVGGGASFGFGSAEGKAEGIAKISRSSSYNVYDTYILAFNVGATPDTITIKDLKNIVDDIDKDLLALDK